MTSIIKHVCSVFTRNQDPLFDAFEYLESSCIGKLYPITFNFHLQFEDIATIKSKFWEISKKIQKNRISWISRNKKRRRKNLDLIFKSQWTLTTCENLELLELAEISVIFTNFMPLVFFYNPWKHQKNIWFLIFSGYLERDQWYKMG